jgi:hypothetical protein
LLTFQRYTIRMGFKVLLAKIVSVRIEFFSTGDSLCTSSRRVRQVFRVVRACVGGYEPPSLSAIAKVLAAQSNCHSVVRLLRHPIPHGTFCGTTGASTCWQGAYLYASHLSLHFSPQNLEGRVGVEPTKDECHRLAPHRLASDPQSNFNLSPLAVCRAVTSNARSATTNRERNSILVSKGHRQATRNSTTVYGS